MDQVAIIDDLAARAFKVGLSMAEVCRRAGVAPSTPSRWRARAVGANMSTIEKLTDVVDKAERVCIPAHNDGVTTSSAGKAAILTGCPA